MSKQASIKKNIAWDFLGKIFNQGVSFVVSIFLARLLMPEDFALIGMVMAFLGVATVFINMGLGNALIQRKEVEDIHYSSIFWMNITLAFVMGVICFIVAPFAADFYEQEEITTLMRVLSFTFLANAMGGVHRSMLTRKLDFKYLSQINVISATISGVIGITCAYQGYGVWSLVIQMFIKNVVAQVMLWKRTTWLPSLQFSWEAVKPLWDYSKKLFASGLLDTIFTRLDVFIIGKLFAPATLGYYARGKTLNSLINTYSSSSLGAVLFPALSKLQDDLPKIKQKVIDFFHLASLMSFFLGGMLYLVSEDLIVLMFTDKWLPTVPLFKIMVLSTFCYPLAVILLTPLKSLGRTDVFLKLEILKKVVLTITYVVGFMFGLEGFLYAMFVTQLIGLMLNGFYVGQVIHWRTYKQWLVIMQYGAITGVGVAICYYLETLYHFDYRILNLLLTSFLFLIYYAGVNFIFKTHASKQLINIIKPIFIKFTDKQST